jgi:uncharacterized protein (TIGR03663 family)
LASLPPKLRWAIFIGLAGLALVIRLPRLGERPMHTDEAVNAYITGQLLEGQSFHYDPKDRHGPALSAVALPVTRIAGAKKLADLNESQLRLVPVLVGVLTVFGFAFTANHLGFLAAALAALLFAIAPLSVYYSRYFIHETLFAMVTLGVICSSWRLLETSKSASPANRRRHLRRGALIGFFAAVMLACKETAVLHFAAFGVAAGWWWLITRRTRDGIERDGRMAAVATAAMIVSVFLFVLLMLYTWGGRYWKGIADLLSSVPHLSSRASGEGHEKPFWYYFSLFAKSGWSGVLILYLGFAKIFRVGIGMTTARKMVEGSAQEAKRSIESPVATQLLAIYAVAVWLIYSLIPYKTPWLALNLGLPLILLVGSAFSDMWERSQETWRKALVGFIAGSLIMLSVVDTRKWVFARPLDEKNPFAYAHTGEDLLRLPERISELMRADSTNTFRIAVIASDPWPLPWYLREFPEVGFWQPDQDPGEADFYLTSPEVAEKMSARLANRRPEFFGVRPEVLVILWSPENKTAP